MSGFFVTSYSIDNTFKSIVHAVAMNENRYQFTRRSIYDDHADATLNNNMTNTNGNFRLEKDFLGAHSDINGGYAEGDLSNASLIWIIKHVKEAGIKVDDTIISREKYNRVDDPVVHDSVARFSVFTPGSEFRWANDASKGYEEASIFNTQDHLELSSWIQHRSATHPNLDFTSSGVLNPSTFLGRLFKLSSIDRTKCLDRLSRRIDLGRN